MSSTTHRTWTRVFILAGATCLVTLTSGAAREQRPEGPRPEAKASASARPVPNDQPGEAQEFFARKRAPVGEHAVPTERYAIARKQMERMLTYSTSKAAFAPEPGSTDAGIQPSLPNIGTWGSLGPGNVGGRTRAILVDPTPPGKTFYAAGVAGGVWKSTNAGASWTAVGDAMANLAVSSLAMDSSNPSVILAGTGEGYFNIDAGRGAGIFKTADGGATWTQLAATNNANFYYVNDIVWSTGGTIYAATGSGVWRSTNGGTSWANILSPGLAGGCLDLALGSGDWLLATCGTFVQSRIYLSTDAHAAPPVWSYYTEAGMGRTSLAVAPGNPNVVYAMAADRVTHGLFAVFRSNDGGSTWAKRASQSSALEDRLLLTNAVYALCYEQELNQGWYDNVIAVDPADSSGNTVWAGGIDLFKSTNGGFNWRPASSWWEDGRAYFLHADQHAIVFHPTDGSMLLGNDGGIFRIADRTPSPGSFTGCPPTGVSSSLSFQNLNNGYGVTQFYYGAVYPSDTSYFGGTQDNGTVGGTDGAPNAWTSLLGGDGGAVAVDPNNPSVLFAEYYGLSIQKSTDGGANFADATTGITDDPGFQFIAPFIMDPTIPQRLWTGGNFAWRTDDQGGLWKRASSALSSGIAALAAAPADGNYVLAGTENGAIHRTAAGLSAGPATVWPGVTPRAGYVSSLTFDPNTTSVAYATYSSFGGVHVWKSVTAGETWTALDGTAPNKKIPDIPCHSIVVDPLNSSRLYLGTDLGVFVSVDGGLNWAKENTGFTNAITESLVVNAFNLYAFTHGRGAWRVPLSTSGGQSVVVQVLKPASSVSENAGFAHVQVKISTSDRQPTAVPVAVSYATADGTAIAGLDYTTTAGTLPFPAGTAHGTVVTIDVPILDDTLGENPETFTVTLSSPSGALLGPSLHTVTIVDNGDAASLSINDATVTEGDSAATSAVFTVTLVPTLAQPVTVSYTTVDGSAVHGGDYAATTGILTFLAGTPTRTIAIPVVGDTVAEPTETFRVVLSAPTNAGILDGDGLGTILDNDVSGTLQFSAAAYTAAEAGLGTVTVTRTGGSASGVTVQYKTSDGSATAPADYATTTGTLTFGTNNSTQIVRVPIVSDTLDEDDETINLQLFNPGGYGTTLGRANAALTILDNDNAGTFQFSSPTYSGLEGTSVAVTVKRTGGVASGATVHFETSNGTATAGDYTPLSLDLTFAANEVQKSFPVVLAHDTLVEGDETVILTLSNPGGGGVVGSPTAILTILDVSPKLAFTAAIVNLSEAAASVALTVNRVGPATDSATVDFATADGTATAGNDYALSSGTLTFPATIKTKTITIPLKPDTIVEGPESFTVTLSNPKNAILGPITKATVNITDNDQGGVFKFGAASYTANEPLSGTLPAKVTITVARAGGIASDVTVHYAASDDTAQAGLDYNPNSGTLSFGAGITNKTFVLEVLPDDLFEGYETINLALDAPTGGATVGQPNATVTIVDSEPVVQFAAASYKVVEGTPKAMIGLKRTGTLAGAISVMVGITGGTATPGDDFLPPAALITMPAGAAAKTFSIDIVNDTIVELDQTVTLALSDPVGASLGPQDRATLTIADNEPVVQFSAATYTVGEAGPKATITLKRTGSVVGTAVVNVAVTGGSATSGLDYLPPAGSITFTSGLAAKTFTIDIVNDHDGEPNETVALGITGATGAFVGAQAAAVLTITDNEPTIQWSAATYAATEPANTSAAPVPLTITVKRSGLLSFPSTVDYTINDGTATADSDYQVAPMTGTLSFAAGQAAQTITILVLPDTVHEGDETILLALGNATGARLGTPSTAVATIRDND